MVSALGLLRRNVGAEPGGDHRIWVVAALEIAIFDARGKAEVAARQAEQLARDIAAEVPGLLLARIMLVEADPVEHGLGHRADRPEEVERHAGAGALSDGTERLLKVRGVDVAEEGLLGLVAAVDAV